MPGKHKSATDIPVASEQVRKKKVAIVHADWHEEIVGKLVKKAQETLVAAGLAEDHVLVKSVPGSFELPQGAQYMVEYGQADAVICIGCLIKGDTPHFHYISEAVSSEIMRLGTRYTRPFIFGVLTTDTEEQAQERAGGKHGNKGEEAALAALRMLELKEEAKQITTSKKLGFSR